MDDDGVFPSSFYSKAPIREHVQLLPLKNNEYYWMLSVDSENSSTKQRSKNNHTNLAPYQDNDDDLVDCCDLEDNFEINPTKSGKYLTSFYVPPLFHGTIVGPRGTKLRELQERTSTLIKVPKPNEGTNIKVTGSSERSVAAARTQIALLLLAKREKMPISHFISIRAFSPEIERNFSNFQHEILNGPSTRGIHSSIFQKVEKFHLTIATLVLLDEKEIGDAKAVFDTCRDICRGFMGAGGAKQRIVLRGVEIMNDDPSEVDVLYGKVALEDKSDGLQGMCNEIYNVFTRSGLVRKQYDNVKLHVTLMNSIYRKDDDYEKSNDNRGRKGKRETFDASYLMDRFRDYYFGAFDFNELHLSIRFSSDKRGYYDSVSTITIN